jgi:hypothetical protein
MDEAQMRFLGSRIWHDRLAFEPEAVLADLTGPVLLLVGAAEANTPMPRYLEAVRRGLDAAASDDVTVCRVQGRTRHAFSGASLDAMTAWLSDRVGPESRRDRPATLLQECLADDEAP